MSSCSRGDRAEPGVERMRLPFPSHAMTTLLAALALAGCSSGTSPTAPGNASRAGATADSVALLEDFSARQVFPADNWWNADVSGAPVDPGSQALIDWISGRTPQNPTATRSLHPDFGPPPYGIPYVGVGASQPLVPVTFSPYGSESDAGAPGRPPGYPIPTRRARSPTSSRARCPAEARAATDTS